MEKDISHNIKKWNEKPVMRCNYEGIAGFVFWKVSNSGWYIGSNKDTGSWIASSAKTTVSLFMFKFYEISEIVGSLAFFLVNWSLTCSALYAVSLKDLLTRIVLLSLKYLLISPIIIGTA